MVIRFGGQEMREVIKAWRKRRGREAVGEAKAVSACTKYVVQYVCLLMSLAEATQLTHTHTHTPRIMKVHQSMEA